MKSIREEFQLLERRLGLLNSSCCDECCGEQVSMAQGHILFEIRRAGSPSMQQVAEELGLDITTFSRQVKSLEAKGLIVRRVSPDDRRVNLLGLTSAGDEVLARIDRFMVDRIERVFSAMTPFERKTVVNSLGLLNRALTGSGCCGLGQDNYVVKCK
jgi:DNA-binding MarR family transcriptional regulator